MPSMPWVGRDDGAALWVLEAGTGSSVVLLHGLAGYAAAWTATVDALAERCRVVAFDQRGHGMSTRNPRTVSLSAFVDDVLAVVDERCGGSPVTLVGQSVGAHVAMVVAAGNPETVARLVLVEGGVGGGGAAKADRVRSWLAGWPAPFPDRDAATRWFASQGMTATAARVWAAGLEEGSSGLWGRFDVAVMSAVLGFVEGRVRWREWAAITCPTLLVLGERSLVDQDETVQMLRANPHATAVCVPGAGHDVHLDETDRWLRVLTAFLEPSAPRP